MFSIVRTMGVDIANKCQSIYPLENVFVHKMKVLVKPAFDPYKLAELHSEVARPKKSEPAEANVDQPAEEVTEEYAYDEEQ